MMSECSEETISERENLILNALVYFKPVERFENWGGVSKLWSLDDSTSKRILNLLEPV